jgi:hypothetical protein
MDRARRDEASRTIAAVPHPPATDRFPTLAFIDRARGDARPGFADAPDALRLERCARALTAQYWSDSVWTTGLVSAAAFDRVCEALEREAMAATEHATRAKDVRSAAA